MLRMGSSTNSSTSMTQIVFEYDGVDDGGGRNGDFNKKFHQPLTSRLRTSSLTDSSTSVTQTMVKYDEVDAGDKSVKKSSKSRKIVKESKSFKGLRNLQRPSIRRKVYQSIDPLSKNSSFCWSSNSFLSF